MPRVMSENQMLLLRYLLEVGVSKSNAVGISIDLWEEEATLEMLAYCSENPNASQAQLLKASSEISSNFKRQRA